jgi:ribosomal protein L33
LQVFVVLSQGITVNSEATLSFEKGQIFDNNNFQIRKEKYFFIRAGEFISDEVFYNLEIDNESVVEKIDEVTRENILYYKLRSKREGTAKVEIYKYDEGLEKQNTTPLKSLRVTVGN